VILLGIKYCSDLVSYFCGDRTFSALKCLPLPLVPRFQDCCQKGFKAALSLAALCSGHTEKQLEASYRKYCAEGGLEGTDETMEVEEEVFDKLGEEHEEENECMKVLHAVTQETIFVDPDEDPEGDQSQITSDPTELNFKRVMEKADKENWDQLLGAGAVESSAQSSEKKQRNPTTLGEVFVRPGCVWNSLWRLAVQLRTEPGGVDTRWLANAKNVRRCSQGLNWHQPLRGT